MSEGLQHPGLGHPQRTRGAAGLSPLSQPQESPAEGAGICFGGLLFAFFLFCSNYRAVTISASGSPRYLYHGEGRLLPDRQQRGPGPAPPPADSHRDTAEQRGRSLGPTASADPSQRRGTASYRTGCRGKRGGPQQKITAHPPPGREGGRRAAAGRCWPHAAILRHGEPRGRRILRR